MTLLPDFQAFRAQHRLDGYSEYVGAPEVLAEWQAELDRRLAQDGGNARPPEPLSGMVNAFTHFLTLEGRGHRRAIDTPNPAYKAGYEELNTLVERVLATGHSDSIDALVASLQVDLDWIVLTGIDFANTQTSRTEHRLRATLERVVATKERAAAAATILYVPSVQPVVQVVSAISDELVLHLAKHPSALHQLRPRQFEELIAHVLEKFGWDVELTPETRDGGYDILAIARNVGGAQVKASYIVECKKYREDRRVGIEIVRQLMHVKSERSASHALIATTSDFTSGVYEYAQNRLDLDTKNAAAVIDWCRQASGQPGA